MFKTKKVKAQIAPVDAAREAIAVQLLNAQKRVEALETSIEDDEAMIASIRQTIADKQVKLSKAIGEYETIRKADELLAA